MTGLNHNPQIFPQKFKDLNLDFDKLPIAEELRYSVYKMKFFEKNISKHSLDYDNYWDQILIVLNKIDNPSSRSRLVTIFKNYFINKLIENFSLDTLSFYINTTKLLKTECPLDLNLQLLSTIDKNITSSAKNKKVNITSFSECSAVFFATVTIVLSVNKQDSILKIIIGHYFNDLSTNKKINILNEIAEIIFCGKCKNIYLIKSLHQPYQQQQQLYDVLKTISTYFLGFESAISIFFKLISSTNNNQIDYEQLSLATIKDMVATLNNLFRKSISKECRDLVTHIAVIFIKKKHTSLHITTMLETFSSNLTIEISKRYDFTLLTKNKFKDKKENKGNRENEETQLSLF